MISVVFFNDTASPEIYTLSLHDALPSFRPARLPGGAQRGGHLDLPAALLPRGAPEAPGHPAAARARTPRAARPLHPCRSEEPRLNSSHANISYAVFCLKKKNSQVATRTM